MFAQLVFTTSFIYKIGKRKRTINGLFPITCCDICWILKYPKKNNCKGNQWRKAKGKEREDKWLKIVANIRTTSNQTTQKVVEKHIKTQFVAM